MATLTGLQRRIRAAVGELTGRPVPPPDPAAAPRPVTVQGIRFPDEANPRVSVLVPVYGQLAVTVDCLRTLAAVRGSTTFEVLLLDDATPNEDMSALATIPGLRYLRAEQNRGFLRNMNWGAGHARGEILLFLNNDTLVDPGFLDPIVETFDGAADVGAVGSMLVYPGGIVQEAGGIIWSDGSGWNYGRHDPVTNSRNLWPRDVDYCSGASLAVRRDLFERLGRFDERFAPAYYEDTDMCFAVREAGYRVVYQPRSRVVHLEGVSHGTDTSSGIKQYQVDNQVKFVEKWAHRLTEQYAPDLRNLYLARVRYSGPRVLIVDHIFPEPQRDSGSLRMSEIVEILHELGFMVHFFPLSQTAEGALLERWQRMGIDVSYGGHDLSHLVDHLARELDLILVSRPHVAARIMLDIRALAPDVPVVYDMVDAHGLRERREAELTGDTVAARRARTNEVMEIALCAVADLTVAVSAEEAELMADRAGPDARFTVIANVHAEEPPGPGPKDREGLLFVGGYRHPPNIDAAIWMTESIMPLLDPATPLTLAGSYVVEEVAALAGPHVTVPGWLEDLRPLYESHRVFVAPLRFGAGVKGKIGEALAHGIPVVTTTIGTEGLHLVDGDTVLIADTEQEFADAVRRLLDDDVLWQRLADNGRRHVEERFGRPAAVAAVRRMLELVGVSLPS